MFVRRDIQKSIGKITEDKLEIILKIEEMEKTRENAKAIEELQEKVGVCTKIGNGKGKHKDKDQTTQKSNGPKDKNDFYLCNNCGKTHKGAVASPLQHPTKVVVILQENG